MLSPSSRSLPPPSRRWPPTDLALLAASVGGMSLAAPLITEIHLPALSIALWRNVMAILAIAPTMVWQYRFQRRPVAPGDLLRSASAGGLFALYLALWLPSLTLTSVASSTGLSFTAAPLWVLLIRRIRGAQVSLPAWAGTIAAFTGVLMLTGIDYSSPRHLVGDGLALTSGIAVAGYLLVGADVRRRMDTTTYTFICYTSTATLLLIGCLASGAALTGYPPRTWAQLALLTVTVQLLGHSVNTRVVASLGIGITSAAILLEAPGATLIQGLWHRTWPQPIAWPALIVVLTGLALVVRSSPPPLPPPPPAPWWSRLWTRLPLHHSATSRREPAPSAARNTPRPARSQPGAWTRHRAPHRPGSGQPAARATTGRLTTDPAHSYRGTFLLGALAVTAFALGRSSRPLTGRALQPPKPGPPPQPLPRPRSPSGPPRTAARSRRPLNTRTARRDPTDRRKQL